LLPAFDVAASSVGAICRPRFERRDLNTPDFHDPDKNERRGERYLDDVISGMVKSIRC